MLQAAARIEHRVDEHLGRFALADRESVGAGHRWTVEQRVHDDFSTRNARFSIQKARKIGNSSPAGCAVLTASPRAESP